MMAGFHCFFFKLLIVVALDLQVEITVTLFMNVIFQFVLSVVVESFLETVKHVAWKKKS